MAVVVGAAAVGAAVVGAAVVGAAVVGAAVVGAAVERGLPQEPGPGLEPGQMVQLLHRHPRRHNRTT